jgi:hypothetical protein
MYMYHQTEEMFLMIQERMVTSLTRPQALGCRKRYSRTVEERKIKSMRRNAHF